LRAGAFSKRRARQANGLKHEKRGGSRDISLWINPGVVGRERPPPHPPDAIGTGPLVTFARSGLSVPFDPDLHSLLDLAEACDVPRRWSCRSGVCHTCSTALLSGQVTYAPAPLEPPPDGQVLLCCARPTTELVVDL